MPALTASRYVAHHVQRTIDDAPGDVTAESGNQQVPYSLFSGSRRQPRDEGEVEHHDQATQDFFQSVCRIQVLSDKARA